MRKGHGDKENCHQTVCTEILIKVEHACVEHTPLSPSFKCNLSWCTMYHVSDTAKTQMYMMFEGHLLLCLHAFCYLIPVATGCYHRVAGTPHTYMILAPSIAMTRVWIQLILSLHFFLFRALKVSFQVWKGLIYLPCTRLCILSPRSFLQTFPQEGQVFLWSSFEEVWPLSVGGCWLRLWEESPAFDLHTFWQILHTKGEVLGFGKEEPLRSSLVFTIFSFLSSSNNVRAATS